MGVHGRRLVGLLLMSASNDPETPTRRGGDGHRPAQVARGARVLGEHRSRSRPRIRARSLPAL